MDYVEKLVLERSTGSVNNLYQNARNAAARARMGGSGCGGDGSGGGDGVGFGTRPGLRPRPEPAHAALDEVVDVAALETPKPRRASKYDPFKDPNFVLPHDLKSFGALKLAKFSEQVLLRALAAHGVDPPPPGAHRKDKVIRALMIAAKKRPPRGSEESDRAEDDTASETSSLSSGLRATPRQERNGRPRVQPRVGRGTRDAGGTAGRGGEFSMEADQEEPSGMSNSFDLESDASDFISSAGDAGSGSGGIGNGGSRISIGGVSHSAEYELQQREAELQAKIARADKIEQDLLATKARMESLEKQLAQQVRHEQQFPDASERGHQNQDSRHVRFVSQCALPQAASQDCQRDRYP
eukprot:6211351-Pleurochrysis_carterae.AAC.1